jgi:geranylgeranylglycerol-phosphate geranylgeranyltransferase
MKDIEDISGDKIERETLPMKIGERKAATTARSFLISAIALSPLPLDWRFGGFGRGYLLVMVADAIFAYSIFSSFNNIGKAQKLIKFGMVIALLSFLFGAI